MRIFVLSDIHVDFVANQKWVCELSEYDYKDDVLILAGDVTHNFDLFREFLSELRAKFRHLFFVPGNHDLWIQEEDFPNSIEKFQAILKFCRVSQIEIKGKIVSDGTNRILIIPIFSWYHTQHEPGTLYLLKPGEGPPERMWSDYHFIKWPDHAFKPVEYFLKLNKQQIPELEHDQVITFSHFLPRQETMFSENHKLDRERMKKFDRHPQFNFSQVAGSTLIDQQLRLFRSNIHVYGHQHINRDRVIEGVRYVSHCLGYPEERVRGTIEGIEQGLKCIWP